MTLWQLSLREIRSRPGRATLTVLSIVIGVAAIVAVAVATTTTRQAYQDMFRTLTGKADLEIVSDSGGKIDETLLATVREVEGVKVAAPLLQRPRNVYIGEHRLRSFIMGIDPATDPKVRDYALASGDFLKKPGTVMLEASFAENFGQLQPGDTIKINPQGLALKEFKIAGLLAPKGVAAISQGAIYMRLRDAQALVNDRGKLDTIHVVVDEGLKPLEVGARLAEVLPPGLTVRPPASRTQLAEETMLQTQKGLNIASGLSIIVSVFIIVNTFLMNVSERRRKISIMRAVGATRKQVILLLIREGLLLGIVGSIIGIGVGLGGAYLLTRAMESLFQARLPGIEITYWPFVLGFGLGLTASFLATIVPAFLASRVSPLEGMGSIVRSDMKPVPKWVTTVGIMGLGGALGVLYASIVDAIPADISIGGFTLDVGLGAVIVGLVAAVFLIPVLLEPTSRLLDKLFHFVLGIEGRLAQRQLIRRRTRSTLTIGVLFIAMSTGVALGITIINNTRDVRTWASQALAGDFYVRAMMPDMATGMASDVPDGLREELEAIEGIDDLTSVRFVSVKTGGQSAVLVVREFGKQNMANFDVKEGNRDEIESAMRGGAVVIGSVLKQRTGLGVGDVVALDTADGKKDFPIVGVVNEYLVGGMTLYMEQNVARRELNIEGASVFVIRARPENLANLQVKLKQLTDRHNLLLQPNAELRKLIDTMMAGIVGGLWVLLALGFVVAAFGIVNTLTMNVLEQTRELGLLRVVAMTRRQVRRTILSQAALMGLLGLIPGAAVGAALAYSINLSTQALFGHAIEFQWQPILVVGSLSAAYLIVVIAAWLPAERAARLDLIDALKYE